MLSGQLCVSVPNEEQGRKTDLKFTLRDIFQDGAVARVLVVVDVIVLFSFFQLWLIGETWGKIHIDVRRGVGD